MLPQTLNEHRQVICRKAYYKVNGYRGLYMKIIIVGCGKVGYTLANQLSDENHDVTVLDRRAETIGAVINDFDVMGVVGNGTSYSSLLEAGIEETDLLIAVTDSDEQNLLCCLIAKKAGDCKTIARVRNPIYSKEIEFFKQEFGLAMVINPEMAAASEISRIFRFPSAIKIDTFMKGFVEMLRFRLAPGCVLCGKPLTYIHTTLRSDVLVCMVKRQGTVTIPTGNFILEEHDIVTVMASPKKSVEFFRKIGLQINRVHSTLLIGGGKIAYYLAKLLLESGIQVRIVERDRARCEELSDLLPKASIICGDGTDQSILEEEGIDQVEGVAALTDIDEENILLSLYTKSKSKAKVVTKINRITFDQIINDLDLDSIIYPKLITADYIIQYARSMQASLGSNMENMYTLDDNNAEAQEYRITAPSAVVGVPLKDLKIKKNILVCCIVRDKKVITPSGQDEIQVGDTVIIVLTHQRIKDIVEILED